MNNHTHDVVVVGAGPAGSAAALTLAAAGLDVLVLDKATFPRDKTCGDGLTTLALRELEGLGLVPSDVGSWTPIGRALLHSPGGRVVELELPTGPGQFAAVARRMDLDQSLVDLVVSRGVTLAQGVTLRAASQHAAGVTLDADPLGRIHARWVIGADGMWSTLRKALGLVQPGYRGEWHAFRQYFTDTGPDARDLHTWFEPDLLPGYAWSFPLSDGGANVGFGVIRGAHLDGAALAQIWPDLLTRPSIAAVLGPDARPDGPHRAWPIPARVHRTTLAAGRALFVGDAARATDIFTGEGIGQALFTGRLAAESIISAPAIEPIPQGDQVSRTYRGAVLSELGPDHQMAAALSRIMTRPIMAEAALRLVGTSAWTRRNVARWLFEDSPRGLALTPRRWRSGVLSGPGAYRAEVQPGAPPRHRTATSPRHG